MLPTQQVFVLNELVNAGICPAAGLGDLYRTAIAANTVSRALFDLVGADRVIVLMVVLVPQFPAGKLADVGTG